MAKLNEIDREHVGHVLDLLWVWMVFPVLGLVLCWGYEAVRAAAGYEADYGRAANRAWYSVAREPATVAARARLIRCAWYSAAFVGAAGIALVGARKQGRRWVWVRRGTLWAMTAISAALIVEGALKGKPTTTAMLTTGLGMHAALGGLVMTCVVAALFLRGSVVGRWSWRTGLAAAVAAGASGFALAGWRPAQVEDLLRQPRDLVHVLAGVGLLVTAGVVGVARGKWAKRWAVVVLLAGAMVAWTGVLMTIDGTDRATGVWQLRRPVVQDAGREAAGK